jgi:hypothetical protein
LIFTPVPSISPCTIRRLLDRVDLPPNRTGYWRTSRLDGRFMDRAEKVLWCYADAGRLAERGIWALCLDEMPNEQVLERCSIRRAIPGLIGYLRRGSWTCRVEYIAHVITSWPEYNRLYTRKRTALPAGSADRPASHRVAGDLSDLRVTAADHTLRLIIEPHPPAR